MQRYTRIQRRTDRARSGWCPRHLTVCDPLRLATVRPTHSDPGTRVKTRMRSVVANRQRLQDCGPAHDPRLLAPFGCGVCVYAAVSSTLLRLASPLSWCGQQKRSSRRFASVQSLSGACWRVRTLAARQGAAVAEHWRQCAPQAAALPHVWAAWQFSCWLPVCESADKIPICSCARATAGRPAS